MTWKTDHCTIAKDFSDQYYNQSLNETDQKFVDEHLAICEDCKKWFLFTQELQKIGQSESSKLKANPYLYASMMDKLEKTKRHRQLSPLKISLAASLVMLIGSLLFFPFNRNTDQKAATTSRNLIGASTSTHYLFSELSVDDILFFWKTRALPIDHTRGEFVIYQQTPQSASIVFTGNPCGDCTEQSLLETASVSLGMSDEKTGQLRHILTDFASSVRGALLVDKNGQLLVSTELLGSVRSLEKELKTALSPAEFNQFKKQTFALISSDPSQRISSFTVHLPQFSDKVVISGENKNHYSLVSIDEFTVRSLRQSIPKMGRIIVPDFENYPSEQYAVVSHNVKLYDTESPKISVAKNESVNQPQKLNGLSIIEANDFMMALKRGLTPEEEKLYQTQLAEFFTNYSKLTPEARKKIKSAQTDDEIESPVHQNGNANTVGFGTQGSVPKKTKSKGTVSLEHP